MSRWRSLTAAEFSQGCIDAGAKAVHELIAPREAGVLRCQLLGLKRDDWLNERVFMISEFLIILLTSLFDCRGLLHLGRGLPGLSYQSIYSIVEVLAVFRPQVVVYDCRQRVHDPVHSLCGLYRVLADQCIRDLLGERQIVTRRLFRGLLRPRCRRLLRLLPRRLRVGSKLLVGG